MVQEIVRGESSSHTGQPIRVLFVIDTLEIGGTERSLLEITRRLDRTRFEPIVCSVYRGSALQPEFAAANVQVIELDLGGKYSFLAGWRALRAVCQKFQPDLIHSMLFRANQISRAVGRWLRIPMVNSFVNVPYVPARLEADPNIRHWKLNILRQLDAFTARWVQRFHSVSQAVSHSNCQSLGVNEERVVVVPRGRELPLEQSGQTLDSLRDELALSEAFPVLVNVGRLVGQKGHRYLLEAMPEVLANYPHAKLLIAGSGPLHSELQVLASKLGINEHVLLLGSRTDVPMLLKLADCFIFPSLYEGLPGAVIEAMLAGCPIVASAIPEIQEVLEEETTGILVPPANSQALSHGIAKLVDDPEHARWLGKQAQLTAQRCYNPDRVTRQMENFYESVLQAVSHCHTMS